MQLRPLLIAVALACGVQPATAAVCVLLPLGSGSGVLGDPTNNYTQMSSEVGGNSAGFTAAILLGSSTITVGAPSLVYTGPHPHVGDQPQVKYHAVGLLGGQWDQAYTDQPSSFTINSLAGVVTTTLDARITNNSGFAQGDYQLKTVVTCS